MKKPLLIATVTLMALGVMIAAAVPLLLPPEHDHRTANLLALKLSPIGIIGSIIAYLLAKPKHPPSRPHDGHA